MPARIYPKRPPKIFLAEWREKLGLTQKQVGERLGTSDVTVSRWETGERRPDLNVIAAYAEALGVDFNSLLRHPDQPSADDLLRNQPPAVIDQAMKLIRAIRS